MQYGPLRASSHHTSVCREIRKCRTPASWCRCTGSFNLRGSCHPSKSDRKLLSLEKTMMYLRRNYMKWCIHVVQEVHKQSRECWPLIDGVS